MPLGGISVTANMSGSVLLLAEADPIALEAVEFFVLTIQPIGLQIPAKPFDERNAFFHNNIQVFIEDESGKYLCFVTFLVPIVTVLWSLHNECEKGVRIAGSHSPTVGVLNCYSY